MNPRFGIALKKKTLSFEVKAVKKGALRITKFACQQQQQQHANSNCKIT